MSLHILAIWVWTRKVWAGMFDFLEESSTPYAESDYDALYAAYVTADTPATAGEDICSSGDSTILGL